VNLVSLGAPCPLVTLGGSVPSPAVL
jgi:hypothetical protein